HPDLLGFLSSGPESDEFLQISRLTCLLSCHRAMHGDVVAGDVFEDPWIRRRRAAGIVLGLQTVDRHDDREPIDSAPLRGNLANRTCHELNVYSARRKEREERVQFAVPNKRFAADDRQVKRPVMIDERANALDQLLAFEIRDLAERNLSAKMVVTVRVTSWTPQGTLARNFDGKRRTMPGQNSAPGGNDTFHRILGTA